jgi:diguanylate cyclase (GGDEF)-like protein
MMQDAKFKIIGITHCYTNYQEIEDKQQRIYWIVGLFVFLILIMLVNYNTSRYVDLFSLCLVPVIVATWRLGLRIGFLVSFLSCLFGFAIDFSLQPEADTHLLLTTALIHMNVLVFITYVCWTYQKITNNFIKLSLIDSLTCVNNRRAFFIQGEIELERVTRLHQPISVLFMDLDNFKMLNDSKGHDNGDKILLTVATLIKCRVRKIDFFARLGGDEFAIILPFTDGLGALALGRELHTMLHDVFYKKKIPITASIGIATFMKPPHSFKYAIKCADSVMYRIKKCSKNNVMQQNF